MPGVQNGILYKQETGFMFEILVTDILMPTY